MTRSECDISKPFFPLKPGKRVMITSINGKEAEWTPGIKARWDALRKPLGTIVRANWYTARPYQDVYSQGSGKEGFVFTVDGLYPQVYDASWKVGKPTAAYIEPRSLEL